jgi:hypothetical protein
MACLVAHIGEMKTAFGILLSRFKEKRSLVRSRHR